MSKYTYDDSAYLSVPQGVDQRYYASSYGRFNTPDPFGGSANVQNPLSWNRYSYTVGDPVNHKDPSGLDHECTEEDWQVWNGSYQVGDHGCTDPSLPDPCDGDLTGACSASSGGGPSTQGGAGTGVMNIANYTTEGVQALTVQNDLRWLQVAIAQDPTCDGWLGGSWNAINYMLDAPGSGATMMAVGVGAFPGGTNAVASNTGTNLPDGVLITVATNGAFFNAGANPGFGLPGWVAAGSNAVQAEILLHELAHDLSAAGFQADGPLQNGNPNVAAQTANNGLVMEKCGGVVNLAAGRH